MVRPLQTYRIISLIAFTLLVIAFILLLLVGLSSTIIKPIYLILVKSVVDVQPPQNVATELRFGVWGFCASSPRDHSSMDGECFGPQLGYTVPPSVRELAGLPDTAINAIETSLRLILVLHPVAAGLAFLTFISSLFLASHAISILTLFLAIITGLVTAVVFGIDLSLGFVVRDGLAINPDFKFIVQFGDGVWMMLGALILTWLAVIFLSARACYCCGVRRKDLGEEKF
ncbi:hypothetical protein AGABI2DRAFT_192828 [Agaricus bisporus var. bisporus H97]|uniref:hypothetical protein n=1 Tax=Agaricus bisporus var. bisporus (strain H97 / ATCC MYA-4626 / FGSC 10389) TaxID=936046 RepID=UPI00029F7708|nr:hypothetical protein AGABI2DRAFT_192828 [Agaricus bisporus var. bisporus H97]EKV47651.1 hypothetical protein AGABI2DRAFT_192828 [Agaricus bisporus var. bisporus H97]